MKAFFSEGVSCVCMCECEMWTKLNSNYIYQHTVLQVYAYKIMGSEA